MIHYTTEQLATIITVPIVTILLLWTIAIFHKNRKQWAPYDIPIVAFLTLSVLRNLTIFTYTLIIILNQTLVTVEYCSTVVWIFNSVHTFQASSLTTLAVIGLFAAKLHRKRQDLRQFLTATHVVYHLFCLTTLCACVGVAAILAQHVDKREYLDVQYEYGRMNACKFMPYQLDIKFNVFIIVLHIFLAIISVSTFILICYHHYKAKISTFDYLKKSTSDLSELTLGMSATFNGPKHYYDTYTVHKANSSDGSAYYNTSGQNCFREVWSDVSNISATVSSTNSRRPCLMRPVQDEEINRTGMETIHPVLIVCYLFYHLPLIGLCIFPRIIAPWPVAGAALWLGLLQDILIPTSLGLVDTRFCKWVSDVYRCSYRRANEKLPQVGLDGKFRPFGSQPQSLETTHTPLERSIRTSHTTEHKFPITNGSLYTSIDGRVPVIHNYRRQYKDYRVARSLEGQSINLGIHSTHLRRNASDDPFINYSHHNQKYCGNCEANMCSSRSDLHHLVPPNRHFNYINSNNLLIKRVSLSQNSLSAVPQKTQQPDKPILRSRVRLTKSEDSLSDVQRELRTFRQNPEVFEKRTSRCEEVTLDCSSSEDEYFTDAVRAQSFDTISLESSYSITTEANCDFEFFQSKENVKTSSDDANVICMHVKGPSNDLSSCQTFVKSPIGDANRNFKITRSNSKRSLENFKTFVSDVKVQRSNSQENLKFAGGSLRKNKSVEVVSSVVHNSDFIDKCVGEKSGKYGGSVPDFKKVFISEYI